MIGEVALADVSEEEVETEAVAGLLESHLEVTRNEARRLAR